MNNGYDVTSVYQLRQILKDLPDDAEVVQVNPVGKERPLNLYTTDDGGLPRVLIFEG